MAQTPPLSTMALPYPSGPALVPPLSRKAKPTLVTQAALAPPLPLLFSVALPLLSFGRQGPPYTPKGTAAGLGLSLAWLCSRSLDCHDGLYHSYQGPAAAAAGTECSRTLGCRCSAASQHRATAHGRCKWGRAAGGTRKPQGGEQRPEGGPDPGVTSLTVSAVGVGVQRGPFPTTFPSERGLTFCSPQQVALPRCPLSA